MEKLVKNNITKLLVYILAFAQVQPVFAANVSEVNLNLAPTHQLILQEPVKKDSKSLLVNEDYNLKEIMDEQKTKDLEDLEAIWKATVEKNTLIKFTIKKLSTPESERRIHSSFMAKSLSALVSGASFLPSFMGVNYSMQTAAFATGKLVNNYINKKNVPQAPPLTDTELIELAGMIENLQDAIINSYFNYKGALNELRQIRSRLVLYNKNYAKAIECKNRLEITISSALYDNMLVEEYIAKENAKKYQLELERLTSEDTIKKLNLYQRDISDELINANLLNGNSQRGNNAN